jgi:Na+/H+ antiporter NhaD/arsenite permease-like protein
MEHGAEIPIYVTATVALLLVAMVVTLAVEELIHAKKSLITGVYAVAALLIGGAFGILPFGDVTLPNHHEVHLPVFIPAVDWEVIAIILGSSLFIDVVSRSGIFTWTAIRLTRMSGGNPLKLLAYYALLTVLFSAVLNNVTAMIIVGSLTAVSLGKLGKQDLMLGFLLTEGLLTNIGGLLTLISSVPNIILGQMANIEFVTFVLISSPYVAVATAMTLALAVRRFGIKGPANDEEKAEAQRLVNSFDERDGIESQRFFGVSWLLLGAFIVTIATTNVMPVISDLGMGFVALAFGVVSLIFYKHEADKNLAALDWDLLFFFIFLFVVINVAEHALVLDYLGDAIATLMGLGDITGGLLLMWSSALTSSVTDNVPLAAVMGKILISQPDVAPHMWWSVIFGTNLGGNFTPIGSASTVVAVSIIHKHKLKLSFVGFFKAAAPFAVAHVILASLYVMLVLRPLLS